MKLIKPRDFTTPVQLIDILLSTIARFEESATGGYQQSDHWNNLDYQEFMQHIDDIESICQRIRETSQKNSNPGSREGIGARAYLRPDQLDTIIGYIEKNIDEVITARDLANCVHLSTFYFTRLFREAMGITPYQYLVKCRINHAKTLLRDNRLSITKVSLESGYNSLSNFIHTFRKFEGLTPSQFRQQTLA